MSRLLEEYKSTISKEMLKDFNYKNLYEVPKLKKIVLNMGIGEAKDDSKILEKAQQELSLIAGFKKRKTMPLGVSVTLRNKIMYEFLDRLINIAMPRIRDFTGLNPKSFDGNGNFAMGIKEQIIFPEINYDKIDKVRGLNITICTTAKSNEDGLELLKNFNMPFKGKETN